MMENPGIPLAAMERFERAKRRAGVTDEVLLTDPEFLHAFDELAAAARALVASLPPGGAEACRGIV